MKRNQKCPKCESQEIIQIPGEVKPFGAGSNITAGKTIFSSVKVTRFLCSNCGFTEAWVEDTGDIHKIKDKYV